MTVVAAAVVVRGWPCGGTVPSLGQGCRFAFFFFSDNDKGKNQQIDRGQEVLLVQLDWILADAWGGGEVSLGGRREE